ncbi:hypothetical protein FNH69_22120 [Salmonella enterica subsp. salamae]|nr:hypothetical protein [Salmonella enterica subsp. salamae]
MIRKLLFIFCMVFSLSGFAEDNPLLVNITPQQFIKIYNKNIGTFGKEFRSARIKSTEKSDDKSMIQFNVLPQIAGMGWVNSSGKLTSVMWLVGGEGLDASAALVSLCSMIDSLDDSLILKDTGPLLSNYINDELDSTPVEFQTEKNKYEISKSDAYGLMLKVSSL